MTTSGSGLWDYRDGEAIGDDSVGYSVEASDGGIGKVDEASTVVGSSYIVVDTGPWIFGKKVMLPAGLIGRVIGRRRRSTSTSTRARSRTRPSSTRPSIRRARTRMSSGCTTEAGPPREAREAIPGSR